MRLAFAIGSLLLAFTATAAPVSPEAWTRFPVDSSGAATLPTSVVPANTNLHYPGRFERSNQTEAVCAGSASAVTMHLPLSLFPFAVFPS